MTANVHPSSSELHVALHEPAEAAKTLEHLSECLACRVRMSRIRHAAEPALPSVDSLQRIVDASTPMPDVVADRILADGDELPEPNEIWRVGRSEALLVWVRRIFDDGVADVVPLVLDVDLADRESVLIAADATPLAAETAAMVSLRTHIATDAFLNRLGSVDISKDVTEVMTAIREGRRPSGVRVGPPIDDDNDQRLEYRQVLRDLLAELTPSAWLAVENDGDESARRAGSAKDSGRSPRTTDEIKAELEERLPHSQCRLVAPNSVTVDGGARVTSHLRVDYLDTAVLVVIVHSDDVRAFVDVGAMAAACQQMTLIEMDADAVAVSLLKDDWPTVLFKAAHMRDAFELPSGANVGPTATLEGYGVVDTICKHLEGARIAWEITQRASNQIQRTDLHRIATGHAGASIGRLTTEGRRARQTAKRTAWTNLPEDLEERATRFVVALVANDTIDDAMTELGLDMSDD